MRQATDRPLSAGAHHRRQRPVSGRDGDEAIGHSGGRRRDEYGGCAGDLRKAARVGGDDRDVRGHRLEHREPEPLVQGWHDDRGGGGHETGDDRVLDPADEESARQAVEQPAAARMRRTGQHELQVGMPAVDDRPRLCERFEVLPAGRAPGVQDVPLLDAERVALCRGQRCGVEESLIDAVVDDMRVADAQ